MAVLSSKQVLQDNNTTDPSSITSLTLTHKALSDVSCLSEFENLQKLDLAFNNLTSLEGLKLCVNLKWLSVVQNKLQSLKGIEGLIKLTVLNAGKNKLKSMDEVSGLVNLRALILNDNDIVSICKLDKMKELNTLVLSRNPISGIGQSLAKINSITKLSLSNCQVQGIDSSLKSCTELKELRLAHNEIKTLPCELAFNIKLQNLDIGNNVIMKWSDLKVLSSLVNLKNLNLQGNPIAEKEDLAKKIKKQVPNLQILNAKPIEKAMKKGEGGRGDDENESGDLDIAGVWDSQEERKLKNKKRSGLPEEGLDDHHEESIFLENKKVKKSNKFSKNGKKEKVNEFDKAYGCKRKELVEAEKGTDFDTGVPPVELDTGEERKHKKQKKSEVSKEKASNVKDKEPAKKSSEKAKQNKTSAIDDGEAPFLDLFISDLPDPLTIGHKVGNHNKLQQNVDAAAGLSIFPKKKKQNKNLVTGVAAVQFSSANDEIGLGGASTWDD
ncbi:uncharacterized protein LOC129904214 [Solanum dulcamara]|uniref:uncharacterized protein LOC129904214 n=1 Tax=Solanum dulcamara TaxID=45834 RepID=UPI002485AFC4|nr:uncharacterized protein LOC129904214 [Solanum dulcamara]